MPTDVAIITAVVFAMFLLFAVALGWAERRTRGITPHFYPPAPADRPPATGTQFYERSSLDTGKSAAGNSAA